MISDEQLNSMSLSEMRELEVRLQKRIQSFVQEERLSAIKQTRKLVEEFGLAQSDVFGRPRSSGSLTGTKIEPKYRNPATGLTWTGRGKPPKWIEGKNREDFLISA